MGKISRSEFLKLSARYTAAGCLVGLSACQTKKRETGQAPMEEMKVEAPMKETYATNLGLQLYTLRDQLAADTKGTLEKVAAIGYKQMELFNPMTIEEMSSQISDLGMKAVATHILPGFITGHWQTVPKPGPADFEFDRILDTCAANGLSNVGVAVLFPEDRQSLDDYRKFADLANLAGEKAKSRGIQFYYHNHSFEFEPKEGTTPFDVMIAGFDPELVKLELDIFWVRVSDNDPVTWIEKLGSQILALHIKDVLPGTPKDVKMQVSPEAFMPVGQGIIDVKAVLTAAHNAGVKYGFVEQDQHSQGDPFDNIQKSYQYLQELGL